MAKQTIAERERNKVITQVHDKIKRQFEEKGHSPALLGLLTKINPKRLEEINKYSF